MIILKKLILIFATIFFLIACENKPIADKKKPGKLHTVSFKTVKELQKHLRFTPKSKPLISAHRGGPMPGYPENAIETFANSLTYAPCILECDIGKTKDGVLVLMHDHKLNRTTTGAGKLADTSFKELQQLSLKDNNGKATKFKIPTLKQALKWAKAKAILSLDIKRGIQPKEIVGAIHQAQAQAYVIVIVYNLGKLKEYHKLDSDLVISVSAKSEHGVKKILNTKIPAKNLVVFTGLKEPPASVYKLLHNNNIRAILGTMHNIDNRAKRKGISVYQKVIKNGADILATDNVVLAAKAITAMTKK